MNCEICNKEFKNLNGISKHIKIHNISFQTYYDKFLKKEGEGYCKECNKETEFISLGQGYKSYCGDPCPTNKHLGENLKQSCIDKYGVSNYSKVENIKEKKKKTFLKNYGKENIFSTDEFKEKNKKIMFEKYGVEHISQSSKIKQKIKETCIKKYNVIHHMKVASIKKKVKNSFNKNYLKKLYVYLNNLNLILIDNYIPGKDVSLKFQCKKCNTIFESTWWNVFQGCGRCNVCFPKKEFNSYAQQELIEFIQSLNLNYTYNDRTIITPKELDIYIPDKKIAIEFNGLYWHSEQNLNEAQKYHNNKTNSCLEKDIQLIHIFEDEWIFKKDIVKSRLKQILNVNNTQKIHARKCTIKEIDSKIKNEFLEKFHIQGKDNSIIKLGAFYNNELIAVMTFSHGNISKGSISLEQIYELNRFCSNYNYHIPGIASKLLKYFKCNYNWTEIFSYADRRWSKGNVYYKLGFQFDSITKSNYWYIKDYKRIHRFSLRKKGYEDKDIPEWVLRKQQGYYRIWDCGNLKFKLINNKKGE